jgi:tryptophan synthase alpha chain
MRSLREQFAHLKSREEKALVLFVTAGDPPLQQFGDVLNTLQDGGADVIELGIPFSDPIADGPTIQASSQRALDRGATTTAVLAALSNVSLEVPVILMGYYNPILRYGMGRFASDAQQAGASGTILCDVTPDEAGDWIGASRQAGLDNIFLAAPTSTDARLEAVCQVSSGFVYAVARTGVTGAIDNAPAEAPNLVSRLRAKTELPICVGFGISTGEHVRAVCKVADGAVVGSWLVDELFRTWEAGKGSTELVKKLRILKDATLQT